MNTQELANARRRKLREWLAINKNGMVSVPKLAAALHPTDEVVRKKIERRCYF